LVFVAFKLIGSAFGHHFSPGISVSIIIFILTAGVIWSLAVTGPSGEESKPE